MQEQRDAKLVRAIDEAMGRFYAFRQDRDAISFEDRDYAVRRLASGHSPEIEYGVSLKATGMHGIYSFYVFDGGDVSHSYSRSDRDFGNRDYVSTRGRRRLAA